MVLKWIVRSLLAIIVVSCGLLLSGCNRGDGGRPLSQPISLGGTACGGDVCRGQ